jgi:hypothetical protein
MMVAAKSEDLEFFSPYPGNFSKRDAETYPLSFVFRRQETLSYSIYLPRQSITVTFLFMWILQLVMGNRPRLNFSFLSAPLQKKKIKLG